MKGKFLVPLWFPAGDDRSLTKLFSFRFLPPAESLFEISALCAASAACWLRNVRIRVFSRDLA
jgi:hypothetical protein